MLQHMLPTLAALSATPPFPHYRQCDKRWGDERMGVEGNGTRATVCKEGCAMSCVAMALAGYNLTLPGEHSPPTPGSLNAWLVANNGYRCDGGDCNNLVLDAPDILTGGHMQLIGEWGGRCCGGDAAKPTAERIQEGLALASDRHLIFIAHVHASGHFVLLTSWDPAVGKFATLDPFYATMHYAYSEISDVLMYSVFPPPLRALVPKRYPLFKQFDYTWANDTIQTKTVGAVGCLMSSTSMALASHGVGIPSAGSSGGTLATTPGTLNAWLRAHHGYVGDNDMDEEAVPALDRSHVSWSDGTSMHRTNDLSLADVAARLASGQPVIANVMHGHHFVLVVGTDRIAASSTLYVNDPGFYRVTYKHSEVVGWRLFNSK